MQSKIEQAHFIIEVSRKLGVPEAAVWEEVKRLERSGKALEVTIRQESVPESTSTSEPVKSRRQVAEEEIIGILLWQEGHSEPAFDTALLRKNYHERLETHGLLPHIPDKDTERTFAMKAEYKYEHGPVLAHSVEELLDTIEEEVLREKQSLLWKKMTDAKLMGKNEEEKMYLQELQSVALLRRALEDRRGGRKGAGE
jgi:DNA-binding Lrp family transcriptional regulator